MTPLTEWETIHYDSEEGPVDDMSALEKVFQLIYYEFLNEDYMLFIENTCFESWKQREQKRYLKAVEKVRNMLLSGKFSSTTVSNVKTEKPQEIQTFNKLKTLRDYMMSHVD